jgi:alpha-amylase
VFELVLRKGVCMFKNLLFLLIILLISCESNSSSDYIYSESPQIQGETFWWNNAVFYEIFVRSFYDSDGDGIGDIQGIIEKLDYLNDGDPNTSTDLGITGIWLMPICESPSYHGYDVTDYREVNEDYGSEEDFQELMNQCHSRGIKVIVDYVMNHSSDQNPWFIASANQDPQYENWYLWRGNDPGYTQPWGGTSHVWHQHSNGSYYYGVFWGGMPDLNYTNQNVKNEMFDIATYWLDYMQADGFRCDAVKYMIENDSQLENTSGTYDFWQDFHEHYKSVNPEALAVGEAWDATDVVLNYVDGKFDFCFEFDLASSIIYAVNNSSPYQIINKMAQIRDIYPYHQYGTFLTNHDQNRIIHELGYSIDKNKLAAAVYLTLPGIPYLYYGEEIGMYGVKPDPDIRRPMQWDSGPNAGFSTSNPWHNINSNYTVYNVEDQQEDENSLWSLYRDLIKIRSENDALTKGTYQAIDSSSGSAYSFLRQYGEEVITVIVNFSSGNSNDVMLNTESSSIPPGVYTVEDLTQQTTDHEDLLIGDGGSITDWTPIGTLSGRNVYILKLIRL